MAKKKESVVSQTSSDTKLHLIGTGGAGINILASIYKQLSELGNGFCQVDVRLLDTTDRTIDHYPELVDKFYRITTKRSSVNELDGTGGDRKDKQLALDIDANIKEYVDKGLPNGRNDYYIVMASASGGSGSLLNPLLIKHMQQKDYNVLCLIVGDSSNLLSLNNTINTITTLQQISKAAKAAQSVIYYNNTYKGVTTPKSEQGVNDKILRMLTVVSGFISGQVQNIDNQDMNNFFNPAKYKSFKVNPGIYSIGLSKGELDDEKTLLCRTMIHTQDDPVNVSVPLLHNKTGICIDDVAAQFSDFPLYLLFRQGVLQEEVVILKKEMEKIEALRNVEYDGFDAIDTADEDDELGLVL